MRGANPLPPEANMKRVRVHTDEGVRGQVQIGQPGQVAHWIERACDSLKPYQHPNTTQPIEQHLT